MSHPSADPAVNAVAARLVGLAAADPSRARILEFGCGSGHHLLPLAARWPEAEFTGIDHDPDALELARGLAAEAGLANAVFRVGGLEDWAGQGGYDFIIAHGVFSWVPDVVKLALFRQIHAHLAPSGVAVVSFNVAAGWRHRMPLVAKARAIQQAGEDVDLMRALDILRDVCESDAERVIVDDMMAKGAAVLAHDDFASVCDPFSLADFAALAAHHGLRWLGEGVPADNLPVGDACVDAAAFGDDALAIQNALDEAGGRTFRSVLLCRADAAIAEKVSASVVSSCFLSRGPSPYEGDVVLQRALEVCAPRDVLAGELIDRHGPTIASHVVEAIYQGAVAARTHPAEVRSSVPDRPRMDQLRLACARRMLPIVDARHVPCLFPAAHCEFLGMMDGTRGLADLEKDSPRDLDFQPWMLHLAHRGFFG
ncbi:MAG: methyltransferase domain-containing protein [Luteolibacter sp.]